MIMFPRSVAASISALVLAMSSAVMAEGPSDGNRITLQRPPGKFVSVGRLNLYIYCKGEGEPTVVFDSGIGGGSLEWLAVQDRVAKHFRACAYDRAGYGWSLPGPFPRTTAQIVTELQLLLQRDNLKPPFILVGHSFGGFNIRYFASRYPREIAGLVLVDASDPQQGITVDATTGSRRLRNPIKQDARLDHSGLPTTPLQIESFLNTRRQAVFAQMDEISHFADSARQVEKAGPLPDVPLMVLSHGRRVWPAGADGDRREAEWAMLQRRLVQLAPQGEQEVVSNAGHNIQVDAPAVVAAAILKVAEQSKRQIGHRQPPANVTAP